MARLGLACAVAVDAIIAGVAGCDVPEQPSSAQGGRLYDLLLLSCECL